MEILVRFILTISPPDYDTISSQASPFFYPTTHLISNVQGSKIDEYNTVNDEYDWRGRRRRIILSQLIPMRRKVKLNCLLSVMVLVRSILLEKLHSFFLGKKLSSRQTKSGAIPYTLTLSTHLI